MTLVQLTPISIPFFIIYIPLYYVFSDEEPSFLQQQPLPDNLLWCLVLFQQQSVQECMPFDTVLWHENRYKLQIIYKKTTFRIPCRLMVIGSLSFSSSSVQDCSASEILKRNNAKCNRQLVSLRIFDLVHSIFTSHSYCCVHISHQYDHSLTGTVEIDRCQEQTNLKCRVRSIKHAKHSSLH